MVRARSECCVYRDWIAERTIQAFDGEPTGTQHEMFSIAKGERVCSGIVDRRPESEWWVKVRTRAGHIGWVRVPAEEPASPEWTPAASPSAGRAA